MNSIIKNFTINDGTLIIFFSEEILNYLPNIIKISTFDKIFDYLELFNKMPREFFHNETGPAYIHHSYYRYFIKGIELSEEEFNKHLHNKKFSDKLNLIID